MIDKSEVYVTSVVFYRADFRDLLPFVHYKNNGRRHFNDQ